MQSLAIPYLLKWLSRVQRNRAMSEKHLPQSDVELSELKKETKLEENYEMLGPIGAGGMGSVVKARHRILGQLVAIKRIAETKTTDDNAIRRFVNEAKAASRLKHENLVSVRDFGIDDEGIPYAIMDYCEGRPLSMLIERGETKDQTRTIAIAIEIAKGLQHAHKLGVVHRDIKPSNIIVRTNNDIGEDKAVIVDFGLAKIEDPTGQKITQTGEVYGSPFYIAPEQAIGLPTDPRTDIYSLGCVIFECIAGVPPFVGDNAMQTAMQHINSAPPKLSSASPNKVPADLDIVVSTCLQKDAADRYQSADELLQALEAVQKGEKLKAPARPKQKTSLFKSKIFWLLNATLFIILCFSLFASSVNKSVVSIGGAGGGFADSLPISQFAKEAVNEDMGASLALFNQQQYMKSAVKLTSSTDILKKEAKSIEEKMNTAATEAERKQLRYNLQIVEWIIYENVAHIGKCFLFAKQYREAIPYLEESTEYFHKEVQRGRQFAPSVTESYQDYIAALEGAGEKAKAQDIRWKFDYDKNSARK